MARSVRALATHESDAEGCGKAVKRLRTKVHGTGSIDEKAKRSIELGLNTLENSACDQGVVQSTAQQIARLEENWQ